MSQAASIVSGARLVAGAVANPAVRLRDDAARRRVLPALIAATLGSLAYAAVLQPRLDVSAAVLEQPAGPEGEKKTQTPHEQEEALASARKVAAARTWGGAALGPSLTAIGLALALWIGFAVAFRAPSLRETLAVAAYAQIPAAVAQVLAIPALLVRGSVTPPELADVLPSHLGVLLGPGRAGPLAGLLSSLDLFTLWALVIVAFGMRAVAGVSTARAVTTTLVLFACFVGVVRVAAPSLVGGP